MHVISKRRLREFWLVYDQSETPLRNWFRLMEQSKSSTLQQLRNTFQTADQVGEFTVFNIGAGKFRLAAKMEYTHQKCWVHKVMAHEQYDIWWKSLLGRKGR
jgi:mRNA interferase HigB